MLPSPIADALAQARADWLAGQEGAWSRYAACIAQIRAAELARSIARTPARRLRPVPPTRIPSARA
jgi:hypothetical protein